jgi:hypothetical protein
MKRGEIRAGVRSGDKFAPANARERQNATELTE